MVQSVYSRFADGVQIAGVSINVHQKGKVFYVGNSTVLAPNGIAASDGNDGKTPDRPLKTIKGALALCTASRGDKIILLPGHAETITAASGINLNVAGVSIIADPVAVGAQRPTITYTTANTATMVISVNDVVLSGVLFIANFLNVATAINLTAAASTDIVISQCEFRDTDSTHCFTAAITTSATANGQDGLVVQGCRMLGTGTAATTTLVVVGAAMNRLVVNGNSVDIQGSTATTGALVLATSNALTGCRILGNDVASNVSTSGAAAAIVVGSGGSGFIADNYVYAPGNATDLITTAGSGIMQFNNFITSVVDKSGYLIPVLDA